MTVTIRKATPRDAAGIARVLDAVARERVYSAMERAWTAEDQERYLASLSAREAFHVAVTASGEIVGYQSLDRYSTVLSSMAHGYRKLVIQVRGSNLGAQRFYAQCGFVECGRLRAQVIVDGTEDDEIVMECFLTEKGRG